MKAAAKPGPALARATPGRTGTSGRGARLPRRSTSGRAPGFPRGFAEAPMADQPEAQRDLIAEMSRDIVADVAPDELPLFRMNSTAYFKNPKKALEAREGQDDTLGLGIEA